MGVASVARSRLELVAPVPRLALSVEEACAALGVGEDFWREHIAAEVELVRRGRRKLVAVAALEAWLAANASRILDDLDRDTGKTSPPRSSEGSVEGSTRARASRAPARRAA